MRCVTQKNGVRARSPVAEFAKIWDGSSFFVLRFQCSLNPEQLTKHHSNIPIPRLTVSRRRTTARLTVSRRRTSPRLTVSRRRTSPRLTVSRRRTPAPTDTYAYEAC
jgi:hypothetical protein